MTVERIVPVVDYTDPAAMLANYARIRSSLHAAGPDPVSEVVAPPQPARVPLAAFQEAEAAAVFEAWLATGSPMVRPHWKVVLQAVSSATGVALVDIVSRSRSVDIVAARQVACFLMRRHTALSLPLIAQRIGGRDHTTILHSIRRVEKMRAQDSAFSALVDAISFDIEKAVAQ